jgi:DNA-binding transcriptional MocR family regulator
VKAPIKNVTLALPEPLVRRFRIYAASRNQSMTSLMAEAVQKMVDEDGEYERARKSFMEAIRNAPDRGLKGKVPWTRDELHER